MTRGFCKNWKIGGGRQEVCNDRDGKDSHKPNWIGYQELFKCSKQSARSPTDFICV